MSAPGRVQPLGVGRQSPPRISEAAWLDQLIGTTPDHEGIAIRFGWNVLHLRPARTAHGWRTPVQGSMGKGWPDLILARTPRLVAVEAKVKPRKVTAEQQDVLDMLASCGVETYVWYPADFEEAIRVLR